MSALRSWVRSIATAALFATAPLAAYGQAAIDQLVEKAHYWEGRGRSDRAAEAWSKLLLADPDHEAALAALALHHAHAGREGEARTFLQRLRQAHPGHPAIRKAERTLLGESADEPPVEQAKTVQPLVVPEPPPARTRRVRDATSAPPKPRAAERVAPADPALRLIAEGDEARLENDATRARSTYERAASISPTHRGRAFVALGDLAQAQRDDREAAIAYRAALAAQPDMPEALRGLAAALLHEAPAEAAAINARLAGIAPAMALPAEAFRRAVLRAEAAAAQQAGDLAAARERLTNAAEGEDALALRELASLELQAGDLAAARAAIERLRAVAPATNDTRLLTVRLLGAEGAWAAALAGLEAVPETQLDDALRGWKRRLALQRDAAAALVRADGPADAHARSELQSLQDRARGQAELLLVVAEAWAQLGDGARAEAVVNEIVVATGRPAPELRLRLAAVLLAAGREDAMLQILREVDPATLAPELARELQALRVGHAVRSARRLRGEGAHDRAFRFLEATARTWPNDPALQCALAGLHQSAGTHAEAQAIYRRVLDRHPDWLPALQGAIESALALQQIDAARALAEEGLARAPGDPRVHLAAARVAVNEGAPEAARSALRDAADLASAADVQSATWLAKPPPVLSADGSVAAILRSARLLPDDPRVIDRQALVATIDRELDRLDSRLGVRASVAPRLRHRTGDAGLGRLTVFSVPVDLHLPLGGGARLGLHVTPHATSAGTLESRGTGRFAEGSAFPLGAFDSGPTGTALAASYEAGGLQVDVGSTPLGFPVTTAVGGARYAWQGRSADGSIGVERRSVEDSVLSWAGKENPVDGRVWGGVVRNGGAAEIGSRGDVSRYWLRGGFHLLRGVGVASNRLAEAGLGASWDVLREVSISATVDARSYAENQRFFTKGHGGYFSPQAFVRAGLPLRWAGEAGALRWDLRVDPGVSWFREAEADVFPLDPVLQGAREGSLDPALRATYPARTSVAFSLEAQPRVTLLVSDFLRTGLQIDLHTGEDYSEAVFGLVFEGALTD